MLLRKFCYTIFRKSHREAGGNTMSAVKDAVVKRVYQLCQEQQIKINTLANRSGLTPSSVYSLLDPKRSNVSIVLIKEICDGLDITLGEFFSCELFDDLEQEIK